MKLARDDIITGAMEDSCCCCRHGQGEEDVERDTQQQPLPCDDDVPWLSLSPSGGSSDSDKGATPPGSKRRPRPRRRGELFECRTCGRRFASFQALGGHRSSHLRRPTMKARPKPVLVHACATCGLGFSTGQALGGHMRRHRRAHCTTDCGDVDPPHIIMRERPRSAASLQLLDLFV